MQLDQNRNRLVKKFLPIMRAAIRVFFLASPPTSAPRYNHSQPTGKTLFRVNTLAATAPSQPQQVRLLSRPEYFTTTRHAGEFCTFSVRFRPKLEMCLCGVTSIREVLQPSYRLLPLEEDGTAPVEKGALLLHVHKLQPQMLTLSQ